MLATLQDPQHVLHKDDEDEGMADPSCVTEVLLH